MGQLFGCLLLAGCIVFHGVALWQVVKRIRHRHRREARGSAVPAPTQAR